MINHPATHLLPQRLDRIISTTFFPIRRIRRGISLVMAPNPTTEFARIKKRIAGTDVEASSGRLIKMSMGEATRRTVTDDKR